MSGHEPMNRCEPRWRRYLLWIGTIASFVLSNLAFDALKSLQPGRWVSGAEYLVVAALAAFWLMIYAPSGWQWFQRWRSALPDEQDRSPAEPHLAELQWYAQQAERWLFALGSASGGMAAAGWFEQEEPALRRLLFSTEVGPETVDQLAWICDALEARYVRQRRADDLLELSERLATIGEYAGRRDLEELAAVRAATAFRLRGDLDAATLRLGVASNLAPPGPSAAAMRTRRALERSLLQLARADRYEPDATVPTRCSTPGTGSTMRDARCPARTWPPTSRSASTVPSCASTSTTPTPRWTIYGWRRPVRPPPATPARMRTR
jgi:hypothetical protein